MAPPYSGWPTWESGTTTTCSTPYGAPTSELYVGLASASGTARQYHSCREAAAAIARGGDSGTYICVECAGIGLELRLHVVNGGCSHAYAVARARSMARSAQIQAALATWIGPARRIGEAQNPGPDTGAAEAIDAALGERTSSG